MECPAIDHWPYQTHIDQQKLNNNKGAQNKSHQFDVVPKFGPV